MYTEISRKDRTLRPYQQDAKEEIFAAWDACDSVMFQMPTGTGKTRLFTSIIGDISTWGVLQSLNTKILIVAHRVELIEQISESLDKYKISHGIIAGGKERDLTKSIQVASIQTITHHANRDVIQDLDINFVIIDEAHHSVANSYRKLWSMYPDAKRLGVTATPWRMNHSGFRELYDKLIVSKPIEEFIREGWLAPYEYYSIAPNDAIKTEIDSIDEFDMEGDYKVSALEKVVDTVKIRAHLLKSYQHYAIGKKGIIYSISRAHSDHICSEFSKAGVNIVRIDSETPRDTRRLYVKRFKEGSIDVIVNVDIFSEGFDCPDIEFGLPDADRDWETDFAGDESFANRTKSFSTHSDSSNISHNPNFDEGSEDMRLIKGGEVDVWSPSDDELLTQLYKEKQCSIEIIASVFKKSEESITKRIELLSLS